jgi:D-glycerate 3-kinase
MALDTELIHFELGLRIAEGVRAARPRARPLIVGLCGSQGSGKSTLAATLQSLLCSLGLKTATLSLDDVYLPLRAREQLARTVHPLLRTRGVPGTHEVDLAQRIFAALGTNETVSLPLFDKALDDRRPQSDWVRVQAPLDVVLFEGWCVGAVPQSEDALRQPVNALEKDEDPDGVWRRYVNEALAGPYQTLFREIDLLILLAAPSFDVVYRWRLEQENELRRAVSKRGDDVSALMTDQQLRRFVSHYERLTRHILAEMPDRADIVVRLDSRRRKTIEGSASPAPHPPP